jgi:hypothetical protein
MEKAISILLIALVLAGCQTTTKVNISTNVPDAQVVVDGKVLGNTPVREAKIKNSSGKTYPVVIEKEGYETFRGSLTTETKTAAATAVVVGYILSPLILPLLLCINALWIDGPREDQYFVLEEEAAP